MAKRALGESFEVGHTDIYWTSPSPVAFHLDSFPGRTKAPFGSKTFIMPAQLIGGTFGRRMGGDSGEGGFGWVTREEVQERVEAGLFQSIRSALSF